MAGEIKFNPSTLDAKYQLSQQDFSKAWILSLNEPLAHGDNEYHLSLHITVQHGRDAMYIMTPQVSAYGEMFDIATMKEFIDWERNMVADTESTEDQLQAMIDYMGTHYVMDHEACPIDGMVLLQWYMKACEMANHFMAMINLGIISLHVTG